MTVPAIGVFLFWATLAASLGSCEYVIRATDSALNGVTQRQPGRAGPEARRLHGRLFVADLHADSFMWPRDPLVRHGTGHVDFPRLRDGNVALQTFNAVTNYPLSFSLARYRSSAPNLVALVAMGQPGPVSAWFSLKARALHQAARLRRAAARRPDLVTVIRTRGDFERLLEHRRRGGKTVGALLGLEGLHAFEGDPRALGAFFRAGFRMIGLAHFIDNAFAGSNTGAEKHGLTSKGHAVVDRMLDCGMVIDLAHASDKTIRDVLAKVRPRGRPVVVSHTGLYTLCPLGRNLRDAQIRAIAAAGGVIGTGFWQQWDDKGKHCTKPSARYFIAAVRHMLSLPGVSIENIALGSDFDGAGRMAFDTAHLALVTQALQRDGFTPTQIEAIMGGNVRALLRRTLPATNSCPGATRKSAPSN